MCLFFVMSVSNGAEGAAISTLHLLLFLFRNHKKNIFSKVLFGTINFSTRAKGSNFPLQKTSDILHLQLCFWVQFNYFHISYRYLNYMNLIPSPFYFTEPRMIINKNNILTYRDLLVESSDKKEIKAPQELSLLQL